MFICSLHIIAPKPGYYFPALILNIIDGCFILKVQNVYGLIKINTELSVKALDHHSSRMLYQTILRKLRLFRVNLRLFLYIYAFFSHKFNLLTLELTNKNENFIDKYDLQFNKLGRSSKSKNKPY